MAVRHPHYYGVYHIRSTLLPHIPFFQCAVIDSGVLGAFVCMTLWRTSLPPLRLGANVTRTVVFKCERGAPGPDCDTGCRRGICPHVRAVATRTIHNVRAHSRGVSACGVLCAAALNECPVGKTAPQPSAPRRACKSSTPSPRSELKALWRCRCCAQIQEPRSDAVKYVYLAQAAGARRFRHLPQPTERSCDPHWRAVTCLYAEASSDQPRIASPGSSRSGCTPATATCS